MTVDAHTNHDSSASCALPAVKTDGRRARSERSREAMVDALLELLRSGTGRPSSAQIAERAGVTQRTLFNQFGDMDSLISAVAARQTEHVLGLLPSAGAGTLEERVERYCDGLAVLLDEQMHVRWTVLTSYESTPAATEAVDLARAVVRRRTSDAFRAELDRVGDAVAHALLDALDIETDPVVWRMRRIQQRLTTDQARAIVARTILALVRDACAMHVRGCDPLASPFPQVVIHP